VLLEHDEPASALFLVLQGVLRVETPTEEYERGPGHAIGYVEELGENVSVVAETDARVLVLSRADYEAALTG
jgi:CRP-like cAMP-binding protein